MAQTRDVATIASSVFGENQLQFWFFVKLEMPSPVNTKRYTQRQGGFVGDIDGSSQTWEELYFNIPSLDDGRDDVLSMSAIEFPNLDYTFTNWSLLYGLKARDIFIYMGFFNPTTGAYLDAFERFSGVTDEAELTDVCRITLRSHITPWSRMMPPFLIGQKCINPYKDPMSCQYAGAEPGAEETCFKSRENCEDRSNTLNFNGFDLLPKPGTIITLGG